MAFVFSACVWSEIDDAPNYLPLNDTEYPYVGVPRLVIETEDFEQIRDKHTEIPAKLQIYGESTPESEVLNLTIRGRGNSTFSGMPKVGVKLEFENKQDLFGMPRNRDWALIPNFADKTHLKNYITYKLASWLGDEYSPRTAFVEVYLNRSYMGLYLLSETVKVGKKRVNILDEDDGFLIEIGPNYRSDRSYFEQDGRLFEICYPKHPQGESYLKLTNHMKMWSEFLNDKKIYDYDSLAKWLDVKDYLRYYWIQELSKNMDGAFHRSIFFTWKSGEPIQMGPVWDFDIAYGNWKTDSLRDPYNWYIRNSGWNKMLFNNPKFEEVASEYWRQYESFFESFADSVKRYSSIVGSYTKNDAKRWPILGSSENWSHKESYNSYEEAVDSLISWINQRIKWINKNIK